MLLHLQSHVLQVLLPAAVNFEPPRVDHLPQQALRGLAADVRARGLLPHEPAGNLAIEDGVPLDVLLLRLHLGG